jgi:uncharacterized protein YutE (UPF0331/DUF86 family)/predicted nucleotidyltransferase
MTSKFQLLPADIEERLKELPRRVQSLEGLDAIWLFGSMVRGEATPLSDVDLAYLPQSGFSKERLERLDRELYGLVARTLGTDEVTLINIRAVPAQIVLSVLSEGSRLICRDPAALSVFAEDSYRKALDMGWLQKTGNREFLRGLQMPEPKIDKERVTELLRLINEDIQVLRRKGVVTIAEYAASQDLQAIVERRLQTATEGCINVGNHLVARLGLRAPQDYADVFRVLGDNGVLPNALVRQMADMARFRNLLVHVYWAIDHERVHNSLADRLAILDSFVRTIAGWLPDHG